MAFAVAGALVAADARPAYAQRDLGDRLARESVDAVGDAFRDGIRDWRRDRRDARRDRERFERDRARAGQALIEAREEGCTDARIAALENNGVIPPIDLEREVGDLRQMVARHSDVLTASEREQLLLNARPFLQGCAAGRR